RGLTPASAWLGPRVAPAFAPGAPAPVPYAASEMIAAPVSNPAPATYAQPAPAPEPIERAAADPMAPRRDAAIFSLQRPASPAQQARPQAEGETPADPMAPRRDA